MENATEANTQPIAVEEKKEEGSEFETKIASLEAEKATILEREANYRLAYLKEKKKNEQLDLDETEEERIRRIARDELAQERLVAIDSEKEELLKKTLKENKELKLAISNKTGVSASTGSHTESVPVVGTQITPEQLTAFKAKGWSDKDIERYKKNLRRYAGT